jgi:enoyl-CoA hydratase/carnithine racemase
LPGDFGTFLALTGVPLSGRDSIKVGLADAFVDVPKTYEHEITAIVTAMDPTCLPNARHARLADGPAAIGQINQVDDSVYQRAEAMRDNTNSDYSELQRRIGYNHHDEQFIDPRLRKPDIVAEADLGYE